MYRSILVSACGQRGEPAAATQIRLDYAYYSPTSLVLKKFGWLEDALKPSGIGVTWTLSRGSNRVLEYLAADSVDFGSTAGLAAGPARANGNPIRSVYVYSRPEWTALVVGRDSPITSVAELKGKKIAATKGTDPYLFLLRTLQAHGLDKNDVEIVHLQHADGRAALERRLVDAWAGPDPHMAVSELQAASRLLYRNVGFNTYGLLNVTERFAESSPELIAPVIAAYERARQWVLDNPEEATKLQAEDAGIALDAAAANPGVRQLLREVGLNEAAGTLPKALSGGMAQRAAIAQGLFSQPRLLLLDEPFSAVDAFTRMHQQYLLLALAAEHGFAVLLVTHDIDEATYLSDRVLVMGEGVLAESIPINLPHPRSRHDGALAQARDRILRALEEIHAI